MDETSLEGHPNRYLLEGRHWTQASRVRSLPVLPTGWNARDKWSLLQLTHRNARAVYRGAGESDSDAAAVRANAAAPASLGVYYFEVLIVSQGRDGYIGVGVCTRDVGLNRLPGWDRNSLGFHGDDGRKFRGEPSGTQYGPQYGTGDVIGVCVNFFKSSVAYTKNGVFLGDAFTDVALSGDAWYPCVGMRTEGEIVHANFGEEPFVFDLEAYVLEERRAALERIILKEETANIPRSSILTCVLHHMYRSANPRTAQQLATDCGSVISPAATQDMTWRREIRSTITSGDIPAAIELLNKYFPSFLESSPTVSRALASQHFVELVRAGKTMDALLFGREQLQEIDNSDVYALLAYRDATSDECPISYLFDESRRQSLANQVNSEICSSGFVGKDDIGAGGVLLDTVCRHMQVVADQLAEHDVAAAAFLDFDTLGAHL